MDTIQAHSDLGPVHVHSNSTDVHYIGDTSQINFYFFQEKAHEAWKYEGHVGCLYLVHP